MAGADDPAPKLARVDPGEIESLVRDLGRLAREAPKELSTRLAALPLRQQAEVVLRLPPRERLEFLLHAPLPMRLVRLLPDAEIHLTTREVGPSDALPLLSLASAEQIRHLMDLESWRGDRFDADRAGAWAAVLLETGEPTMLRFLRNADDEILMLLFARWMRVRQIEIDDTPSIHGHGETEAGTEEGFLSPDGFHRFSPTIAGHAPAVRRIAEILFRDAPERYQQIVWGALTEMLSEVEEEALRWRQSRLEEHGFPTWDEALEVYAPPAGARLHGEPPPPPQPDAIAVPRAALRIEDVSLLVRAVDRLEPETRERVLMELTSLANRLLVADGVDTGDTAAHRQTLRRAASYVSIALAARGVRDEGAAARTLDEVPAIELFREGFRRAAELKEDARKLVQEGWPKVHPRALQLLDGLLRSRLEGLLERRPLYFEVDPSGRPEHPYREFRTLEEIEETRVSLELVEVLGHVMESALGWDLPTILNALSGEAEPPRFSSLFVASLGHHARSGQLRGAQLPGGGAHRLGEALDPFVKHIAEAAELTPRAASQLLAFGRASLVAAERT